MPFACADDHSLFINMEYDLKLTWPALEAWAHDETLLMPMGLHRGFVRVQPSQWDGSLITMDQLNNTSLSSGNAISIPYASRHSNEEVCVQHTLRLYSHVMSIVE